MCNGAVRAVASLPAGGAVGQCGGPGSVGAALPPGLQQIGRAGVQGWCRSCRMLRPRLRRRVVGMVLISGSRCSASVRLGKHTKNQLVDVPPTARWWKFNQERLRDLSTREIPQRPRPRLGPPTVTPRNLKCVTVSTASFPMVRGSLDACENPQSSLFVFVMLKAKLWFSHRDARGCISRL